MGDVLSQSEIDSLLAALSSGELDADDMQENGEKLVSFLGHETSRRGSTALTIGDLVPKLLSMGVNIVLTIKLLCFLIGASLVAQW